MAGLATAIPDTAAAPALRSSGEEWRESWPLPFIGALGLAGAATLTYSSGVFMEPITAAFGWSRAQYSFALTLALFTGLLISPIGGRLVDRFGPRPIALWGCVLYPAGFSLLATVDGNIWRWYAQVLLIAATTVTLAPMIWTTAIVSRFRTSRGLALGIALSGVGLSSAIWPALTNAFIDALGWRLAFPALAGAWLLVVGPLIVFFFRSARTPEVSHNGAARPPPQSFEGVSFKAAVLSKRFAALAGAGAIFSFVTLSLTVHMFPILTAAGIGRSAAAGIAALIGVSSIIGRVVSGLLIDRLPVRRVGAVAFLLPIISCVILNSSGLTVWPAMAAIILLGLASGAELDIITYLVSRYFGLRNFGAITGLLGSVFAAVAGFGPLLAGMAFDHFGGYTGFIWTVAPLVFLTAVLIFILPDPPPPTMWLRKLETPEPEIAAEAAL